MKPSAAAIGATLLFALAGGLWWWQGAGGGWRQQTLAERLASRVTDAGLSVVPCAPEGSPPLVLLALGQSNAGNHGEAATRPRRPVVVATPRGCVLARDPLPGATGRGGSIWSRLPARLALRGVQRPVVLAVLAVDATSIAEWTDDRSPLAAELARTMADLSARGLEPAAVLWQQGEADALRATPPELHVAGLQRLLQRLRQQGWQAPLVVARSTRCRSEPAEALRAAIAAWAAREPSVRLGPDTDALHAPGDRSDGCHFSAAGLDAAAELWAGAIVRTLQPPPR